MDRFPRTLSQSLHPGLTLTLPPTLTLTLTLALTLTSWIGSLGDQTLYSYMSHTHAPLLYKLGCEWNRQLSMQVRVS